MSTIETLARTLGLADQTSASKVFLHRDDARLYTLACLSNQRLASGEHLSLLEGQVVVIKGNIDLKGLPTTAGSQSFFAPPATEDAPIVQQLLAKGALPMGHANMSEFAFSGLGLNPSFGTPRNALNPQLAPGGSSSGCASAIALGLADLAIGTDTSGSARIPAAYQGIVGFRPTIGRYHCAGVFPLAPELDTPGPMARNMAGLRLLDDALRLPHASPSGGDLQKNCLIWPDLQTLGPMDPEIEVMCDFVTVKLKAAGWRVERRRVESLEAVQSLFSQYGTLVSAAAPDVLARYTQLSHPRIDRNISIRLTQARQITTAASRFIRAARPKLQATLRRELGSDLLLLPTVPHLPPRMDKIVACPDNFAHENARALRLAMLGAFLDMPSLSLPCGVKSPGHALTIAGRQGADDQVLNTGSQVETLLCHTPQEIFA